jgi:hypothetical protein
MSMDTQLRLGMKVIATDGEAGVLEDILSDKDGMARYLVVRDKGVFGSDVVLPANQATAEGEEARLPLTKAQIHAAERYDEDRHGAANLVSAARQRFEGDRS